ncbi:MAG: site-specific integrase [Bacteroidia bacterium]|jgi:integrase|nr:site-specific integrase [Bacteroidia bacterium]
MKAALELASKRNRDGLFEIYVRIQDGNAKRRVKANIAVAKNQFKSKNHNLHWVRNHANAKKINADLKLMLDEYNDSIFKGLVEKRVLTPALVKHQSKQKEASQSLVKYFEQKINQMLEYNQRRGYVHVLKYWCNYTESAGLGDLEFKQVTVNILKGFENYLYKKGLSSNTVYGHMKRLRSCYNMAIKEEIISVGDYIFKAYTMPKVRASKKEKLSPEELKAFMSLEYENGTNIKTAQQIFLLSFNLAGMRIEDVLTLTWKHVKKDRIEYEMTKTGALSSFRINPQIKAILDYFKTNKKPNSALIVPMMDEKIAKLKNSRDEKENELYKKEVSRKTSLVNKFLKEIAKDAEIDKKVSSHIARHTFASIAIKRSNGDINFVQNALKHSNPKITQIYLASLDNEYLDKKMDEVTNLD